MDIYCVTPHFLGHIRSLFRGHNVQVLPEDYRNLQIPLLIFTGGEDIDPSRYRSDRKPTSWYNAKRDEWELAVFNDYRRGRMSVGKILGICRGLQLINVGLGGTLVYDIAEKYGNPHPYHHEISWVRPNLLSGIISRTNSMHHQCIEYVGEGLPFSILGIEPRTSVIEAIMWHSRILAVQFHPEMFPEGPEKRKMAEAILNWATDTKPPRTERTKKNLFEFTAQYGSDLSTRLTDGNFMTANSVELPTENLEVSEDDMDDEMEELFDEDSTEEEEE